MPSMITRLFRPCTFTNKQKWPGLNPTATAFFCTEMVDPDYSFLTKRQGKGPSLKLSVSKVVCFNLERFPYFS